MKKSLLVLCFCAVILQIQAQILRVATSTSTISSQIPGYSQVSTISTKSYNYTPSIPQDAQPAAIAAYKDVISRVGCIHSSVDHDSYWDAVMAMEGGTVIQFKYL